MTAGCGESRRGLLCNFLGAEGAGQQAYMVERLLLRRGCNLQVKGWWLVCAGLRQWVAIQTSCWSTGVSGVGSLCPFRGCCKCWMGRPSYVVQAWAGHWCTSHASVPVHCSQLLCRMAWAYPMQWDTACRVCHVAVAGLYPTGIHMYVQGRSWFCLIGRGAGDSTES